MAEIAEEQRLVAASKELVKRFEAKSRAAISRVWGDLTPARAPTLP